MIDSFKINVSAIEKLSCFLQSELYIKMYKNFMLRVRRLR